VASNSRAIAPRAISSLEVYPLAEAARRLGWGRKTLWRAQKGGLRTVVFGRAKYVRGKAILDFFERLEADADGRGRGEQCKRATRAT